MYLLARDPRKPVLALAAIGLCGFALVVALDAVRTTSVKRTAQLLSQVEIYLVAVPSVAWFAVLVELSRPSDSWRARTWELLLVGGVGALTLFGAMMAGSVDGSAAAGPPADVRGDLDVHAGRDGRRGAAARTADAGRRRRRCSRRCSSRWPMPS